MRALTVFPGRAGSAGVEDLDVPAASAGPVLVEMLGVGVCGTDREIASGEYGAPPPGRERLIIGHESLGRVVEAPAGTFRPGDLVTAIVRRADPVPCRSCAAGEWDMCENGLYTEHGITGVDGFCAELVRLHPGELVRLDPDLSGIGVLVEPTSVVVKGWEMIDRMAQRSRWRPERVLVTGAGPIGLLAALLAVQRGYDVHVLDIVTSGPKPALVRELGASYHVGGPAAACPDADITIECTGIGEVVLEAVSNAGRNGIVCLTGVSSGGRALPVNSARLNRELVLENNVVFGTVNANRRHYEIAARALATADRGWLERLITRRVPLDDWATALEPHPHDIKAVIEPRRDA